jgi:hypothetical protein
MVGPTCWSARTRRSASLPTTESRARPEAIPASLFVYVEVVDRIAKLTHFSAVKSLLEIEAAIAKLPPKARRQLVRDIPKLCPDAFPTDGWDSILYDTTPRPALTSLLDKLDAEYPQKPENFLTLNEKSLRSKK